MSDLNQTHPLSANAFRDDTTVARKSGKLIIATTDWLSGDDAKGHGHSAERRPSVATLRVNAITHFNHTKFGQNKADPVHAVKSLHVTTCG